MMSANNYECKISVFRALECGTLFDWYRLATLEELEATGEHIIIEERISEDLLWERLRTD